uniref:Uncharacterized protein n=1 Tax=Anguilla anguilla TaxID=7936 RepID=A0A0E9PF22_ANGAN
MLTLICHQIYTPRYAYRTSIIFSSNISNRLA